MANKFPSQDAGPTNWSAADWSLADDNAKDTVKPGAGDVPIFTVNSGDYTLDEASASLGGLTMTGYAGTLGMGSNTIDVNGNAILDGTITATAATLEVSGNLTLTTAMTNLPAELNCEMNGTGTLLGNGVSLGSFEVNTAGTVTSTTAHTFVGNLIYTTGAASIASAGPWTHAPSGVADISWDTSGNLISRLVLGSGGTSRLTGNVITAGVTIGAGTGGAAVTQSGSRTLTVNLLSNDVWNQTESSGTVTIDDIVLIPRTTDRTVDFLCGSSLLGEVIIQNNFNIGDVIMIGNWDLGAAGLLLKPVTNGLVSTLDTGGFDLIVGAIAFGRSGGLDIGAIDFGSGTHSIASLARTATNSATAHTIDFAASFISLSGILEGANIDETNTSGTVSGGTVNNVDVSGSNDLTHIYPAGATGNTGVNALFPEQYLTTWGNL